MARILVVDDEPNNRLLLTMLLQHAGHTVLEAQSGLGAAEIAVSSAPDLVVVDLSLPDIPGVELIRRLRADERTRDALIALYTATGLSAAIEELTDLYGIAGIIPKPADPPQILQAFDRILRSR